MDYSGQVIEREILNAPAHAHQETHDGTDQEDHEEHFGDAGRAYGDAAEAEESRDQRDDQEDNCVVEHERTCMVVNEKLVYWLVYR